MRPFKARRVCGIALVPGIRFQFLFPTGIFWFFVSGSVTGYRVIGLVKLFTPATGARPKETEINLMDCICRYIEVEMKINCMAKKIKQKDLVIIITIHKDQVKWVQGYLLEHALQQMPRKQQTLSLEIMFFSESSEMLFPRSSLLARCCL